MHPGDQARRSNVMLKHPLVSRGVSEGNMSRIKSDLLISYRKAHMLPNASEREESLVPL